MSTHIVVVTWYPEGNAIAQVEWFGPFLNSLAANRWVTARQRTGLFADPSGRREPGFLITELSEPWPERDAVKPKADPRSTNMRSTNSVTEDAT